MITVVNRRHHRGGGVYIGRPSLLGNPFKIGEHGTRKEVIANYRVWLRRQIQQRGPVYSELLHLAETARRGDLFLICWCEQPYRQTDCHGDILKSANTWINETRKSHHCITK
jgi:Domain of unknown function (DUF4326)